MLTVGDVVLMGLVATETEDEPAQSSLAPDEKKE